MRPVAANRRATNRDNDEKTHVRKERDRLTKELDQRRNISELDVKELVSLDSRVAIKGTFERGRGYGPKEWVEERTWGEIFWGISPHLLSHPSDNVVESVLKKFLEKKGSLNSINTDDYQTVKVQLMGLGLVNVRYTKSTGGRMGLFWSLTPKGHDLLMQVRTVKK